MSRTPSPRWNQQPRPVGFRTHSFTMTGDLDLVASGATTGDLLLGGRQLFVDPGGAARNLDLPPEAGFDGCELIIYNAGSGAENLTVRDDSGVTILAVITPGQTGWFMCDGSSWRAGLFVEPGAGGAFSGTDALSWTVNRDAVATSNEDPFLRLLGGDAVAAPNDDLVRSELVQDSTAELVYFRTQRSRNAGAYADVAPSFQLGVPAAVDNLDPVLTFNGGTGAAARTALFTFDGSGSLLQLSGSDNPVLDLVGTGGFQVKANAGDANPEARLAGSALSLGAGGASAVDIVLSRGAAGRLDFTTLSGLRLVDGDVTLDNDAAELLLCHDDVLTVVDPAAPTKRVRFDAGAVTAGQTRVFSSADWNMQGDLILRRQTTSITPAQVRDLHATPISIVIAPAAGQIAVLSHVVQALDFATVAHDDAAADGNLVYRYTGGDTIMTQEADGLVDAVADRIEIAYAGDTGSQQVVGSAATAIEVANDGAAFTGAGDSPLVVDAYYYTLDDALA